MVDFSEKHVAILALYTFDLVVRDSQKTSFTKKQLTFKLYFCFISQCMDTQLCLVKTIRAFVRLLSNRFSYMCFFQL